MRSEINRIGALVGAGGADAPASASAASAACYLDMVARDQLDDHFLRQVSEQSCLHHMKMWGQELSKTTFR